MKPVYRVATDYHRSKVITTASGMTAPNNYSELELELLKSRVHGSVAAFISDVSVVHDRTIISDSVDSPVYLYLRSGDKTVYFSGFPDSNFWIPSSLCPAFGSKPLSFKQFEKIVTYWSKFPREGVLCSRNNPISTPLGVIPLWWLGSILEKIDLNWLSEALNNDPDYPYTYPRLRYSSSMRIGAIMIEMPEDLHRNSLFTTIVAIGTKIIEKLYRLGAVAIVSREIIQNCQLIPHPSGLIIPSWYDPNVIDPVSALMRRMTYQQWIIPTSTGIPLLTNPSPLLQD